MWCTPFLRSRAWLGGGAYPRGVAAHHFAAGRCHARVSRSYGNGSVRSPTPPTCLGSPRASQRRNRSVTSPDRRAGQPSQHNQDRRPTRQTHRRPGATHGLTPSCGRSTALRTPEFGAPAEPAFRGTRRRRSALRRTPGRETATPRAASPGRGGYPSPQAGCSGRGPYCLDRPAVHARALPEALPRARPPPQSRRSAPMPPLVRARCAGFVRVSCILGSPARGETGGPAGNFSRCEVCARPFRQRLVEPAGRARVPKTALAASPRISDRLRSRLPSPILALRSRQARNRPIQRRTASALCQIRGHRPSRVVTRGSPEFGEARQRRTGRRRLPQHQPRMCSGVRWWICRPSCRRSCAGNSEPHPGHFFASHPRSSRPTRLNG